MPLSDAPYIPESKEEDRLMEDIHIATRRAYSDGMSKRQIASLLAFMASATLDPRSDEESSEPSDGGLEDAMGDKDDDVPENGLPKCPECDDVANKAHRQMGGRVRVEPCGCDVPEDDVESLKGLVEVDGE